MLRLGSKNVSKLFLGGRAIANAYLGNKLVWQASQPLPYDAEVEWIGIGAGQACGLDIYPTVETVFQTRASFETSSGELHFGLKDGEYVSYRIFMFSTTLYFDLGNYYAQGGRCTVGSMSLHVPYSMEFGNNYIKLDGVEVARKTTSTTTLAQKEFLLGGSGASKVYSAKITTGGVVVRDLIPVRKDENGVSVGYFYDKVSGRLFGISSGSGSLTVGPDVYRVPSRVGDYVQSGLVAIYDGIENVGYGVHSDGTTTWVNIVDGSSVSMPTGFAFGSDCVSVSNANQQLVVSNYSGSDFTVEYVFALADSNTGRECLFESLAANQAFRYKAASAVQDFWAQNYYTKNLVSRTGNVGVRHHIASAWSGIYSSGSVGSDYVDGAYLTGGALGGTSANLGGFRIGRSGYTTYQDVCCVRLYSRALTSAEIATNYAIDKVRFNLT